MPQTHDVDALLPIRHAGVLPQELYVPVSDPPFALTSDLSAASCGYSFLLQASNVVTAEAAFNSLNLRWLVGRVDAAAVAALRTAGASPVTRALSALIAPDASSTATGVDVLILFSRKDVLFDSQTTCRVRADVRVALGRFNHLPAVPPVAHDPLPGEAESIHPNWSLQRLAADVVRLGEQTIREMVQSAVAARLEQAASHQPVMTARKSPATALPVAGGTFSFGGLSDSVEVQNENFYLSKHVELGFRDSFDVSSWLGTGVLEIAAPFAATANQAAATMRVPAEVSAGNAVFTGLTSDAALLLSPADPAGLVALTTRRIRERAQLQLVNEISLVGGPATARVQNLAQLKTQAFPCGHGACPLSVGAVIVAWHVGMPNTRRFVGSTGYGVLWSEEAVALLVRYCWDNRYFPHALARVAPVKIMANGTEEDAAIEFDFSLRTLTGISIEHDANARTDVLHFNGQGQVVPRGLRLADGRLILPGELADPIFAPGEVMSWDAFGTLTEELPTVVTADSFRFQLDVTQGTTSRLGRPFTEDAARNVTYSRVSGYAKRIMLLAE
jgi:hypothetical protein